MNAASVQDLPTHAVVLQAREFDQLAAYIHKVSGIRLPGTKRTMLEGRLRRRLAATGAVDFAEYCAHVFDAGEASGEVVHLINAVTTNKTDFFREPEHFRILAETVLSKVAAEGRRAKLWSAACSIGAEPYTMAMVASDFAEQQRVRMPPPAILATDLSTAVLATAQRGIYPAEMIEPVPPAMRKRYVLRARDPASNEVRIVPALRALVRFGQMNLMSATYPVDRDFDAIFLRNVLIYFDRETQAAVLRRLCEHLRPGGALAIGHSETLNGLDLPLQLIGHTMFRRS
jgi:chemotaxis protein methyltransferase CheR